MLKKILPIMFASSTTLIFILFIQRWLVPTALNSNITPSFLATQSPFYLPIVVSWDLWETEPNNACSDANGPLLPNRPISGYHNDENDYFFLDLTTKGNIDIWLVGQQSEGVQMGLYYKPTGEKIEIDNTPPFSINPPNLAVGQYCILVHINKAFVSETSYSLTAQYTHPPTPIPPSLTPTPIEETPQWCDDFNDGTIDLSKWRNPSDDALIYEDDGVLNFAVNQTSPEYVGAYISMLLDVERILRELSYTTTLLWTEGEVSNGTGADIILSDNRKLAMNVSSGDFGSEVEFLTCPAPDSDYEECDHASGPSVNPGTPYAIQITSVNGLIDFQIDGILRFREHTDASIVEMVFYLYANPESTFHTNVDNVCVTTQAGPNVILVNSFEEGVGDWWASDTSEAIGVSQSDLHPTDGIKSLALEYDHSTGNAYFQRTFTVLQDWSGYETIKFDIWTDSDIDVALALATGEGWDWNQTYAVPVDPLGDTIYFNLSSDWNNGNGILDISQIRYIGLIVYPNEPGIDEIFIDYIRVITP